MKKFKKRYSKSRGSRRKKSGGKKWITVSRGGIRF